MVGFPQAVRDRGIQFRLESGIFLILRNHLVVFLGAGVAQFGTIGNTTIRIFVAFLKKEIKSIYVFSYVFYDYTSHWANAMLHCYIFKELVREGKMCTAVELFSKGQCIETNNLLLQFCTVYFGINHLSIEIFCGWYNFFSSKFLYLLRSKFILKRLFVKSHYFWKVNL